MLAKEGVTSFFKGAGTNLLKTIIGASALTGYSITQLLTAIVNPE